MVLKQEKDIIYVILVYIKGSLKMEISMEKAHLHMLMTENILENG